MVPRYAESMLSAKAYLGINYNYYVKNSFSMVPSSACREVYFPYSISKWKTGKICVVSLCFLQVTVILTDCMSHTREFLIIFDL